MNQRRNDSSDHEPRVFHPLAIFTRTIGAAFGQAKQRRGVKSDCQRAVERIVEENVVNQETSIRRQSGRQTRNQRSALRNVPVVEDIRQQNDVAILGNVVREHIARLELHALDDAVLLGHFASDLEYFRAVPNDRSKRRIGLKACDSVDSGAAADVEQVLCLV